MSSRRKIGEQHESLALSHLKRAGLKLIKQNYHCRAGEIDLILHDHLSLLIFVEVRYRKSTTYGTAAATVTREKQRRIKHSASHFLQRNGDFRHLNCRFDVFAIEGSADEGLQIQWIKNAFY